MPNLSTISDAPMVQRHSQVGVVVDPQSARSGERQEEANEILDLPIPNFVKCIFNPLMGNYLYKTDSFEQVMRKMALLVFLVGGLCGAGPAVYTFIMFRQEGYLADLLCAISLAILSLNNISIYLAFRQYYRQVSDTMATLCICGTTQLWIVTHIAGGRQYDLRWIDLAILCLAIIMNVRGLVVFGVIHVLLVFQSIYNDAYREVGFALELPRRDGGGLERLLFYLLCCFPGLATLVAIWFVSEEQKRRVRAADKSVGMAQQIVKDLRKYNTDKVQEMVSQTLEGDDQEVNRELLVSFAAMVENLEKYRPFLPNYLFHTSSGEDHDSDEDDEGAILLDDTTSVSSKQNVRTGRGRGKNGSSSSQGSRASSRGKGNRRRKYDDDDEGSVASYGTSHSTATAQQSVGSSALSTSGLAMTADSAGAAGVTSFRGVVSMALVEVQTSKWFSTTSSKDAPSAGASSNKLLLSKFTDAVFEVAKSTKASIHSMLGDTIQLSWNATHRVAQPELKAAQLLLQMRAEAELVLGAGADVLQLSGAACSGMAEVHSVFSSKLKQFALFVDAHWLPALEKISQLAVEHRTILVDSNTKDPSSYNVTAQAVDCLRYEPRASRDEATGELQVSVAVGAKSQPYLKPLVPFLEDGSASSMVESLASHLRKAPISSSTNTDAHCFTLVHELTSLLDQSDHDEWMYQLNSIEKSAASGGGAGGEQLINEDSISKILVLAVEGKFGEAVEEIEKIRSSNQYTGSKQQRSGIVHYLFSACESQMCPK